MYSRCQTLLSPSFPNSVWERKLLTLTVTLHILLLAAVPCFTQESPDSLQSSYDSLRTPEDTLTADSDSLPTEAEDSLRAYISGIIEEVNRKSAAVDGIHSEGEITVKTREIDNSGSIEIKAKKKDDLWFLIEGPMGIDIAEGHFGRKNFLFYDARNEKAISGSTNISNIGALTKIRCTFDDLLNAFTGTVRILKSKSDSLNISEEGEQYVIWAKRGNIIRKYWVDKDLYVVRKYAYYGKSGSTLISLEFSNFTSYGDAFYAKRIEVRRPKQGEYFKLELEQVSLGLTNLSFWVNIPSGTRRINWK
jgi:outer membrane lipoprotein-sorting protein